MRNIFYTLRIISFCTFFWFAVQFVSAQSGTLKGTVRNGNGDPLFSASITVAGKKIGTTTDVNGNYLLDLPSGQYTIMATFVGQSVQSSAVTISAGATTELNFTTQEVADLTGVVVTGTRSRTARSKLNTPVPVDVISHRYEMI